MARLCLSNNEISDGGPERIAGVLGQCPALTHLDLNGNGIEVAGAESLAGVIVQCAALTFLNLYRNYIDWFSSISTVVT